MDDLPCEMTTLSQSSLFRKIPVEDIFNFMHDYEASPHFFR
jgi:hypothetical protein